MRAAGGGSGGRAWAVGEIQRTRILNAVVEIVVERGLGGMTVASISARAGISRGTFYECFDRLEDCLPAILDLALQRSCAVVEAAFAQQGSWRDGARRALAATLAFLDSEPGLARVCLLHTLVADPATLAHRERVIAQFRAFLAARVGADAPPALPLAFEGTVVLVMGMVYTRLARNEPQPLIELLGPLLGVILAPYLDATEVAREIERGEQLAREIKERRALQAPQEANVRVPDLLLSARSHRARLCLLYIAEHPGVSNQQVAAAVGIAHREQVSRLLDKLTGLGLLAKRAGEPGSPNAWSLSARGERVALALAGEQ